MMKTIRSKSSAYLRLMRFDKPVGTLLLLWPTLMALWVASGGVPRFDLLLIFILGVVVMRAAGCVINDIADREFDPFVERTKSRPLASGELTVKEAFVALFVMSLLAFFLVLQLNRYCILLSFIALMLTLLYPFTKRFFVAPQAVLSIAFAFGVPMAFAAVNNEVGVIGWLLYTATACWIIAFDTAYAMADRDDDRNLKIYSTAILFGKRDRLCIAILQLIQLVILMLLNYLLKLSWIFSFGVLFVSIIYIFQSVKLKSGARDRSFAVFLSNNWVGLILFTSLFLSYLI